MHSKALVGALLLISIAVNSHASTINVPFGQGTCCFGEGSIESMGQTFTAPADSRLDSFSFWLNDQGTPSGSPDTIDFAAYVMGWDGTKATGPILYQSGQRSTTDVHAFVRFDFFTGGLVLVPGATYVAFLSVSNYLDSVIGYGQWALNGSNPYPGGTWVLADNGGNFSLLTSSPWFVSTTYDTQFFASFSEVSTVPEPASVLFLGTGLAGLAARMSFIRRRRAHR